MPAHVTTGRRITDPAVMPVRGSAAGPAGAAGATLRPGLRLEPVGCLPVEADHGNVEVLQFGERAREVLHERDRYVLERAGGGLRESAGQRWAMSPGHDEARRAEHGSGAQDGTDVVRVGHLVEDDDGPA